VNDDVEQFPVRRGVLNTRPQAPSMRGTAQV
jgi:hypothetical protein